MQESESKRLPYPTKIGIIFDCDGVLVDTEYNHFLAWQSAFNQFNITFSLEEYLPCVGYSRDYIAKKISGQKQGTLNADIAKYKYLAYQKLQAQCVSPLTAAIKFVQQLAAQKQHFNIVLGLASAARRSEIMINLQQVELAHVFDVIVSGTDDLAEYCDSEGTNKPKPYIYQKTAHLLEIEPSQCIVFEDTYAGVTAAVAAGMTAFAVPNRYTQQHDFRQAARVLSSFDVITIDDLVNSRQNK